MKIMFQQQSSNPLTELKHTLRTLSMIRDMLTLASTMTKEEIILLLLWAVTRNKEIQM